ncbi:hypothetical protein [Alicyclobacillus sp. SP_1]|uniref:hypothetical protein n=1 Tax=Alicyclobacillus sp. SP_1 TaxID=2942475 RepID=UPI002157BB36|nr:hypothetical protein [Alicyclobacillus sp. SP_1]
METFFDVLIQVCKQRVERSTGKPCDYASAERELDKVLKTVNLDVKYKYNIRRRYESDPEYRIEQEYAIAIAIAFKFPTVEELNHFLSKASYSLSDCHQKDIIIRDIIASSKGKCTLFEINDALYDAGFKPLIVARKR